MQIHIRSISNLRFELNVEPYSTALEVKELIQVSITAGNDTTEQRERSFQAGSDQLPISGKCEGYMKSASARCTRKCAMHQRARHDYEHVAQEKERLDEGTSKKSMARVLGKGRNSSTASSFDLQRPSDERRRRTGEKWGDGRGYIAYGSTAERRLLNRKLWTKIVD
ncbi:hypothetical protein GNI_113480 [Gregarina niphandrodes]|uniref:Uncharacterized protein n=1 Tax=Gregarina niphandrodes TaxID=110365 RepID=A0A023B377_GRENI|nr:hypothetical protein GNI_113480 [Gregarina niphandrodes]EZG55406.1 hypothetical protein GNI_113480 [Gregarina niphandrodes]|eukprot:XP_011131580.1 hypothetical protein GNI_113480 [Gregarina niphandrodes]